MELQQKVIHKGSLIKLRPEFEERYIILHKHPFPGVLSQIKKVNIRNYSIFLFGGILFSYFEYIGNNFDSDLEAIADETTKEWWKLTDPMQEPLPARKAGEWWAGMEQLSLIEGNTKHHSDAIRYAWTAEIKPGTGAAIRILLSNVREEVGVIFKQCHFQNQNVYFKDGRLYVYVEYAGNDYSKDQREFKNDPEIKKIYEEFEKNLKNTWEEMKEVFHAN